MFSITGNIVNYLGSPLLIIEPRFAHLVGEIVERLNAVDNPSGSSRQLYDFNSGSVFDVIRDTNGRALKMAA